MLAGALNFKEIELSSCEQELEKRSNVDYLFKKIQLNK